MKIYEVDLVDFEINTYDFEYVGNIPSFEKELDDLYQSWFYSKGNAIKFLKEQRKIIERK